MLGPILFVLYLMSHDKIFSCNSVGHHTISDDTQPHRSCSPDLVQSTIREMEECVNEVKSWMTENKLQFIDGKMEAMLVTSRRASIADLMLTSLHVGLSDTKFAHQLKKT